MSDETITFDRGTFECRARDCVARGIEWEAELENLLFWDDIPEMHCESCGSLGWLLEVTS